MKTESAVRDRYEAGAQGRVDALCCPVDYDSEYLRIIPREVIEKDYGCGNPSRYLRPGETVLDLGSGTGKICFIAAQIVGPEGRIIGVDMTDSMLEVARRNAPIVADRLGYANVSFRKGRIQDLALDLDLWEKELVANPIATADAYLKAEEQLNEIRRRSPMIPNESIDVVVSNCVLNLVEESQREQLFREVYRVLKSEGRAVISDIVSDRDVPQAMKEDPELWSGCLSGAYRKDAFLDAFATAGFAGIEMLEWQSEAWRTVDGIEFRSITVQATKGPRSRPEATASQHDNDCCSAADDRTQRCCG